MNSKQLTLADPLKYEYSGYIRDQLAGQKVSHVTLTIGKHIQLVEELNYILAKYYSYTRTLVPDYQVEIDILFHRKSATDNGHDQVQDLGEKVDGGSPLPLNKDSFLSEQKSSSPHTYSVGAVGGTFDHLHDGHKILLSLAIYVSYTYLIIGITGAELLKNKKYSEVLESFEVRMNRVINFIERLKIPINYQIYEINDICGPTGFVKDINTLIVSGESIKGGDYVNKYREQKGFPQLDVIAIKVIGSENADVSNSWQGKLSSTDIRKAEYKKKYGN
ncbi:uncharacterized protein KQ657_004135 [Scheffersomyces spartinae]|uniref:Cytidyltransferase-like domain-containing protein n=1 Tax=Scheffersomyces spartinae TaxID=45513 RepID=A0A9P7VBV4_9ASCO|nr:uncharacterized protein KQ657_004135 [Scheffersomyces spartinae]KAG7195022.1 hypothetical protein KQ657_004135 [Scheffersomyces spartinae]